MFLENQYGIFIEKTWTDDDAFGLQITVKTDYGTFTNQVTEYSDTIENLYIDLLEFKENIHSGQYDITLGNEDAMFRANLKYGDFGRGHLFISIRQKTQSVNFFNNRVSSEATLYLKSKKEFLEAFILWLEKMTKGKVDMGIFECKRLDDTKIT